MFYLFLHSRKEKKEGVLFRYWHNICIKPFHSFIKSQATRRLEALIKQHDRMDLEALQCIQKGIITWLEERQKISARKNLIINFSKEINQKVAILQAQASIPPCMSSPLIAKPFEKHLFFVLKKDAKKKSQSLFLQCQKHFLSLFSICKKIPHQDAIKTAPLAEQSLFFENCYVIYHNLERLKTHHGIFLTTLEQEALLTMQNQLNFFMQTIDEAQKQTFDTLPNISERFRCDLAYKIRHKLFACIGLPLIDCIAEFDSLLGMTLDIIGIG